MATVNYSVPDEVKEIFNKTFAGRNKSAVIARVMVQAVEEEERRAQSDRAIDRILSRRATRPALTTEQIRAARNELRG